jgi:hypothetical protein
MASLIMPISLKICKRRNARLFRHTSSTLNKVVGVALPTGLPGSDMCLDVPTAWLSA